MRNVLDFLIEAGKLKKMPRTGFVWLEIKNPETIAQHTFRVAILNWVLGEKTRPKLDIGQIIKISLVHDLCEVYAGDMTPYWGLLPEDKKKRFEMLKRWVRLPQKAKQERDRLKFKKEKESLQKIIQNLNPDVAKEIMCCWLKYEKFTSKEGRFVKQGDKIETLLQAIEYWGSAPNSPVVGWWEEVESLVDNPILLEFLDKIDKKFYKRQKINGDLKFILEIGVLKAMPRRDWIIRKVKNPETIAEHSFLLAIASWVLGKKKNFNLQKLLKMSLVHKICEVYVKSFFKDYQQEKTAIKKIVSYLSKPLQKEMVSLWDDFKQQKSKEGKFLRQLSQLVTYLQALQYFQENKKFPILACSKEAKEWIDDPLLIELMREMEKRFLTKKSFF